MRLTRMMFALAVAMVLAAGVAGGAGYEVPPWIAQREAKSRMDEQADNVWFVRPVGWQRQDNPDGTVVLVPPDVSRREVALIINQGREREGKSLREWFDASWRALLYANTAMLVSGGDAQSKHRDGFETISTSAVLQSLTGGRTYTAFFVAGPGTRVEALAFMTTSEALYRKHIVAVNALVDSARFANLQLAGPPAAGSGPPTAPPGQAQGPLQIGSMYTSFARQEAYAGALGSYRFNFLVLYANGRVYRGGAVPLVQGPPAIDLNHPLMQYNLGTYKVIGDNVHITMPSSKTQVYRRHADALGEADGTFAWRLLPRVDVAAF